jgi:stage V sporulation protein G
MEITEVKVFPVAEDKLKAFVSITFDRCFVVSDIKIIQGGNGLFVSMPSKKRKDGSFRDIAHPLDSDTRRRIEEQIIREYREVVSHAGGDATAPLRELGSAPFDASDEIAPRRIASRAFVQRPVDQP